MNTKKEINKLLKRAEKLFAHELEECKKQYPDSDEIGFTVSISSATPDIQMIIDKPLGVSESDIANATILHPSLAVDALTLRECFELMHQALDDIEEERINNPEFIFVNGSRYKKV
jgi:hypothetical protein